jgi:hypothetical protein
MASIEMNGPHPHHDRRRAEQREYRLICMVAYPLFLVAVIAERLLSLAGLVEAAPAPRRNVFSEARAATRSCIPFAFR